MKVFLRVFFIFCIVLGATVCFAQNESEGEIEPTSGDVYLADGVTVVLPAQWKPYSYVDDSGARTGYLPELWQAWGEATGIATRIVYEDLSEALESLKNKDVDIVGGLRHSESHVEFLDYTDSVQSSTSVLAIREHGDVDCSNVLAKGTVALMDDADVRGLAEARYSDVNFVFYPDEKQAIVAFKDGAVNGLVVGYPYLVSMDPETGILDGLNICRTFFYHEVYAGVQKGETELLALVNDGLSDIPADVMERIEKRWFLVAEKPKPDLLSAALPAGIAFCLLIGVVIFWASRRS